MKRLVLVTATQLALLGGGLAWQVNRVERGTPLHLPCTWISVQGDLAGSYATVSCSGRWDAAPDSMKGPGHGWAIYEPGDPESRLLELRAIPQALEERRVVWGEPPSLPPGRVALRANWNERNVWLESDGHARMRIDDRGAARLRALVPVGEPDSLRDGFADVVADRGRIVALHRITIRGESFGRGFRSKGQP